MEYKIEKIEEDSFLGGPLYKCEGKLGYFEFVFIKTTPAIPLVLYASQCADKYYTHFPDNLNFQWDKEKRKLTFATFAKDAFLIDSDNLPTVIEMYIELEKMSKEICEYFSKLL